MTTSSNPEVRRIFLYPAYHLTTGRALTAITIIVSLSLSGCGGGGGTVAPAARNVFDDAVRLVSAPRNAEEYETIFRGQQASRSALERIGRSIDDLGRERPLTVLSPAAANASQSLAVQAVSEVRSAIGRPITIIGHNESGFLRFGDGSAVSISELADATPQNSLLLVLSCNADIYIDGQAAAGPVRVIDIAVAASIERRFYSMLSPEDLLNPSRENLQTKVQAAMSEVEREQNVRLTKRVSAGLTTAGGGYVVIETQR